MANTKQEPTAAQDSTQKEEHESAPEILTARQESPGSKSMGEASNGIATAESQKGVPMPSGETRTANSNPRPSLVQLGSGSTTMGQPKRFSAVNINKKFLEKNSSASVSSTTSQPVVKAGTSSLVRPQAQPSASHSRLVTAKLTSASPASSGSGIGWSRPSSAAPPNIVGTHSPSNNSPPLPVTPLGTSASTSGAPQLPHVNKVIQPQPRTAAVQLATSQKDGAGSSKPAWGNIKPSPASKRPDVRDDFPTAAEVASLQTAKSSDTREIVDAVAASKQARMEEADTFRGLHLDPNAHHWDEMEEDDDNFLDGVIEFGDGRQYKIETTDCPLPDSSLAMMESKSSAEPQSKSSLGDTAPIKDPVPSLPVSKEERFADDFDRSWPRSRPSPPGSRGIPLPPDQPGQPRPRSAAGTQDPRSSQEASKVLFNERSNRLEPYSSSQRPGPGQFTSNRRNWQEPSLSPSESRAPPAPQSHNVQLLQKTDSRRRYSNANVGPDGGFGPASYSRDRDRDQPPKRDGLPPSPRLTKDSFVQPSRDRDSYMERGRRSDMGPPPLPMHAMHSSTGDGARQPATRPNDISAEFTRPGRRTSRDSRYGPPSAGSDSPTSARLPSQSPVLSHTSAARISPNTPISPLPNLSAPEIDEARRDLMQSAAARAKQRRQQEEQEREKEKERARRKAAELEEQIIAAEAEKKAAQTKREEELLNRKREEEVNAVIEDAIKSAQTPPDASNSQATVESAVKSSARISENSKSLSPQQHTPATNFFPPSSPIAQVESWRSRTSSSLPLSTPQTKQFIPPFVSPPQSALNHVESLADNREDLEVVDFSEMGQFLGVPDISGIRNTQTGEENAPLGRPSTSRPVASDFFDDSSKLQSLATLTAAEKPWRPKPSQNIRGEWPATVQFDTDHERAKEQFQTDVASGALDQALSFSTKSPRTPAAADQHLQTLVLPSQPSTIRSPRSQSFYKEPAMAAFDDTMSRIKGALDKMQAYESVKEAVSVATDLDLVPKDAYPIVAVKTDSHKERWILPARRHRQFIEVLDITSSESLRPPTPTRNDFIVRLPSVTQFLGPIAKKQMQLVTKPLYQSRMDILSFDPPVEGMSSRDLSINDVLFHKPTGGFRGKPRYRVHLPRVRIGPKVNIPAHAPQTRNNPGSFGRASSADEVKTWRKPPTMKLESDDKASTGLTTTSRSPPPDTIVSDVSVTSVAVPEPLALVKTNGAVPAKSRVPKMPVGSSVAFYRDPHIDTVEEDLKPSVNFIVSSELESRQPSQTSTPNKSQPSITVTPSNVTSLSMNGSSHSVTFSLMNGAKESSSEVVSPPTINKADKSSEDITEHISATSPLTHHGTWAITPLTASLKESSARAPDPEHLKAVWSQTSNRPGSHGLNSLEGIGDDLTALPFTLQDVKSEDGETPPPSVSTIPSRMSLHEVTRAFQQVPPSSGSSSTHRTPPLAAPPARPASYYSAPPPPPSAMRPGYPYPSPIMSHSPSPGIMYPTMLPGSPTPSRMPVNGPTTLYSQPMWMPMPAAAAPQNHANILRPYPTQMVPYSPGPPPIYGSQAPAGLQSPQQANGAQTNRDRNVPLMSPVMSHTGPTMYGSPVLMHASVMPGPPPNPSYMMPPSRGQARTDSTQVHIQNPQQQLSHVQPHPNYNPLPSSFTRPTW